MAGSRLEDLAVDRFSLGETAGTMVREAALEGLGDGYLDHGRGNGITGRLTGLREPKRGPDRVNGSRGQRNPRGPSGKDRS